MKLHYCFISTEAQILHGTKYALQQTEQYHTDYCWNLEEHIKTYHKHGFKLLFVTSTIEEYQIIKHKLLE